MPKIDSIKNVAEAKKLIPDLKIIGNGDAFQVLSMISSKEGDWLQITKVMRILGVGCVLHTMTQQGDNVSESMLMIPGTRLDIDSNQGLKIVKL